MGDRHRARSRTGPRYQASACCSPLSRLPKASTRSRSAPIAPRLVAIGHLTVDESPPILNELLTHHGRDCRRLGRRGQPDVAHVTVAAVSDSRLSHTMTKHLATIFASLARTRDATCVLEVRVHADAK